MQHSKEEIEKSLSIIGNYFGSIEEACIDGFYEIETKRKESRIEEIYRCIQMYTLFKGVGKLRGRKLEVLSYYVQDGFNKQTKIDIMESLKIKDTNLNNINHELRSLGLIVKNEYNHSTNDVSKELMQFKKFIIDDKKKFVLINLK